MEITQKLEGEAIVASVSGRLDAGSSAQFDKNLADMIAEGARQVVLDFSSLVYISSAGLRSVLVAAKELKNKNGILSLAGLKAEVKEVFDISGFSSILPIYETVSSAIDNG